jgi:imidazolonepropionase-like amidohydrolase
VGAIQARCSDAQYYAAQDAPAKKDVALENLRPLVSGTIPALFSADSAREIVRATRIADEFSLRMILLSGREAYRDIDIIKAKNLPVVVSLDLGLEPSAKSSTTTPDNDGPPQAVLDERHDTWFEHSHNIKKLYDAGIPMAFSSLGLGGGVDDFLQGLRKVIATGVPREAVLKSVTSESAAILGIADKTGTIEPGKLANLVLFSGDFADPKSEVKIVIVEGNKIELKKGGAK